MRKVKIEKDSQFPPTSTLEIETDIPLPSPGSHPRTKLGRTLRDLKVGESFVTDVNINTVHSHARYYLGPRAIVYRKLDNGEHRVWRIK